ncbi:acetyl-CoA synthetase-like protein [Biscogniauxia marginata]|nr:acetyl-CoA synthetase-like protein [Biscogniauxia marginata]
MTDHERVARSRDDLLPHVVDRLARERPEAVYGEWVTGSSVVAITYAQFGNVINGLAWWLVEQLGGPGSYGPDPDVLTYVGPNDVRYSALVLAAIKAGYVELLTKQYSPYILNRSFQDLRQNPFVVMHTSGTTGLPKPITWTHETCAQVLNSKSCETPALLAHLMVGAIPYGNVVITPVAAAIPTARGVVDALKQTPAQVAVLVPSVVAELARDPRLLDYCATHLETIIYIGGDLPQDVGDRVAAKIYLRCQWGATETGIVPQLLPPELLASESSGRSLWRYVRFHTCVGAVFDEVTEGIYELLKEYRTKDLFEQHPVTPDLWCWRARADDIIVFLNGEKTNPISMEQHITTSNPGAQRCPSSESPLTTVEQAALIERVWPSVNEANLNAPAHARVETAFILVVPAGRRLIRAGKGTFKRGPSISQYTEEIEKLYADADVVPDDHDDGADGAALHIMGLDGVTRLVRQHVLAVTGWSSLKDADNFFECGMDSLQGLQLMRALRRSFHRDNFALSTIYENHTVPRLVAAILSQNGDGQQDERTAMVTLLATYRKLVQQIPTSENSSERPSKALGPVNVLLTGSTGTVGTHLLRALRAQVGLIIHAAWPVNFNLALSAFRPQLAGLINLLTLAAAASPSSISSTAQFVFISSVAAVGGHKTGPPPEEVLSSLDTPAVLGYARAKFLAELLVESAADKDAEAGMVPAPAQPMAVDRALAASPELRRLEPVGVEWMRKWVEEWIAMREE